MKPRKLPNTAFPGILGTRTSLVPLFSSQAPVCFSKMEAKVLAMKCDHPLRKSRGDSSQHSLPRDLGRMNTSRVCPRMLEENRFYPAF